MVLVARGSKPWLPDNIIGRCDVCKELVDVADWKAGAHPCYPCSVSYSLQAIVNPDNTPWVPGYRFYCRQASGARTRHQSRGFRHMVARTYSCGFEIDQDGILRQIDGPRVPDHVMEGFERQYQRERPGSNWYPGADDEC